MNEEHLHHHHYGTRVNSSKSRSRAVNHPAPFLATLTFVSLIVTPHQNRSRDATPYIAMTSPIPPIPRITTEASSRYEISTQRRGLGESNMTYVVMLRHVELVRLSLLHRGGCVHGETCREFGK